MLRIDARILDNVNTSRAGGAMKFSVRWFE